MPCEERFGDWRLLGLSVHSLVPGLFLGYSPLYSSPWGRANLSKVQGLEVIGGIVVAKKVS